MESSPRDPAHVSRTPLLWWVAAFVLHRAVVIALGFDGVYFWEETYRLVIAEAIRGGWNIPLHDLQADPYAGGSLVFSALGAVVTSVTGSSLVALKSVALAWSAAGFGLWLVVADRVFGRAAAHALGLVWLAAPPVFVVFNVLALGSHSDTVTLAGLQMLLMYRYLDDPARGAARLVAWMAAAGIGVWFSYAGALPLAACAVYALLAGALPTRRWPVAAAGFLAGFSPWIVHAAVAGGSLHVVQQTFDGSGGAVRGYLANLVDITAHGVPVALYFRDIGVPGDVKLAREFFSYPYLAIYAAAWASLVLPLLVRIARSGKDAAVSRVEGLRRAVAACPELPVLVLFPLFLVVIAASNQEFNDYGVVRWITFRIIVPALPALLLTIALAASRWPAPLRAVVLGACALAGLVGTGQLLVDGSDGMAARESEARVVGAEAVGHLIVFKHGTDAVVARERILAMPSQLRTPAWRGVGFSYAYLYGTKRSGESASKLTTALLSIEEDDRGAALEGARLAIGAGLAQVAPLAASARRDALGAAIDEAAALPNP